MLPFFSTAHLYCKLTGRFGANGYTTPYFIANGVAGMCWLYLCMFFFWQVLTALKIRTGQDSQLRDPALWLQCHLFLGRCTVLFTYLLFRSYHNIHLGHVQVPPERVVPISVPDGLFHRLDLHHQTRQYHSILIFVPFLFEAKLGTLVQELLQKPHRLLVFLHVAWCCPYSCFPYIKSPLAVSSCTPMGRKALTSYIHISGTS